MTAICNRKTLRTLLAALLILCLTVSLSAVSALAEDATGTDVEDTAADTATGSGDATGTDGATDGATDGSTESAGTTDTATGSETGSETEKATAAETQSEEEKQARTRGIINLCVGGVILLALIVLAFVFRAKIPAWFKGVKSECGKIVWCPKDKLKKNSVVVVVIIVAITLLIALLDIAFSTGIIELGNAVKAVEQATEAVSK